MYAWKSIIESVGPSEELRVAVTFPRPDGGPGPTQYPGPLTLKNVTEFVPKKEMMDRSIDELSKLGFKLTGRGCLTVSMKCTRKVFQDVFTTTPLKGARLIRVLEGLIDGVYIQRPHLFPRRALKLDVSIPFPKPTGRTSKPSAKPPRVNFYHLNVPSSVAALLRAKSVHCAGTTGKGIRVVMIDSGFDHSHPFFCDHGYTSKVVLAGGAKDKKKDGLGHGTGESANIFSVAPHAEFIGVKIGTDDLNSLEINPASLLEGFYKARLQKPDIISISGGQNLNYETSKKQRTNLPRSLKALEAEILYAIASGIVVVAAAGNGEFFFPAMMPDVISVGGVFVDRDRNMKASDLASAFDSKIYPGRHVPDICGLVGMKPKLHGNDPFDKYILLPVPVYSEIDQFPIYWDGTKVGDGWAGFSGTSAAAPQIAGVCALLKAKNPNLTPMEIKEILQKTAIKVLKGKSNLESSDDLQTPQYGADATGAGLVDAFRAWQQV